MFNGGKCLILNVVKWIALPLAIYGHFLIYEIILLHQEFLNHHPILHQKLYHLQYIICNLGITLHSNRYVNTFHNPDLNIAEHKLKLMETTS